MTLGRLYLIPIVISEDSLTAIPQATISRLHQVKHLVVERARTARRYISQTKPPYQISDLNIIEIEDDMSHIETCIQWLLSGHDVGVMSESGMPGIADPGQEIVLACHQSGIQVIPLVGPNSIMLALSASGLGGQNFAFRGYLPIKEPELKKELSNIENLILRHKQTQICIETPYRNDRLLQNMMKYLNPKIMLCIASDITGPNEKIMSYAISDWKKVEIRIGKVPAIFVLGK